MSQQEPVSSRTNIKVPVIVVPTSPFTTIIFDDMDHLNATLEQINRNTFDYIKLCRTTMAVDGEIQELSNINAGVIMTYTSAFLYPKMPSVNTQTVIQSVNKILLKLFFGGIRFDSVLPEDIGDGILYESGYFLASGGSNGAGYNFLMAMQHQALGNLEAIKLIEPRTFTKRQIDEALNAGKAIVEKFQEINPSMFLDGITHYKRLQLASSLIFLWTTIETLIGKIWAGKVIPKGEGIAGRKKFVESNAWQAACKVEVLFQLGLISKTLYSNINTARVARNSLVHRGQSPELMACHTTLEVMFALVALIDTDYQQEDKFVSIVDSLKNAHEKFSGPIEPRFWREIPSVPGDDKWGNAPYPRYPEIELVSLKNPQAHN